MDSRFFCGHCGERVSRSLYYRHKKLFYSNSEGKWRKNEEHTTASSDTDGYQEFSFSDSEDMEVGMTPDDATIIANDDTSEDSDFDMTQVSKHLFWLVVLLTAFLPLLLYLLMRENFLVPVIYVEIISSYS